MLLLQGHIERYWKFTSGFKATCTCDIFGICCLMAQRHVSLKTGKNDVRGLFFTRSDCSRYKNSSENQENVTDNNEIQY